MLDHKLLQQKLEALGYDGSRPRDRRVSEAMHAITITLENYELSDEESDIVLDLLSDVGRDKLARLPDLQEDHWEDFNYGNVKLGDFVRIRKDAYDTEPGNLNNGLVGVINFASHGRFLVDYIGRSAGNSGFHAMDKLQSLRYGVE